MLNQRWSGGDSEMVVTSFLLSWISMLAGYWANSGSQLATTAAIEGVPFTLPGPGWVTSIPMSIVGTFFNQVMLLGSRAWLIKQSSDELIVHFMVHRNTHLTPPSFMLTFKATFAKYWSWPRWWSATSWKLYKELWSTLFFTNFSGMYTNGR